MSEPPNKGMNLTRSALATRTAALAGYPQCWGHIEGEQTDVTMVNMLLLAAAVIAAEVPTPPPPPPWGHEAVRMTLQALAEPPLPLAEQPTRSLRLVIVPSFPNRRIVVVRLLDQTTAVEIVTKSLGDWFPKAGTPSTHLTRKLPSTFWSQLGALLDAGFWRFRPAPFPNPRMADGSAWFLEVAGPRGHSSIIQHSPSQNAFRELCQALLRASSLDFSPDEYVSWLGPA